MTAPALATGVASSSHRPLWYDSTAVRMLALAATCTGAAGWQALHLSALANNDIWWHVRTGLWMLQSHSIPQRALFSQAASLSWVDSSWGFDLLNGLAVHLLGLRGIVTVLMALQVVLAGALFALALSTGRRFWFAIPLSVFAQCCIVPLQPRPALCSAIFLAIELAVLLRVRRSGDPRTLYWLPLLFVLWANFDRQFSYGVMALVLFCVAEFLEQLRPAYAMAKLERGAGVPLGRMALITAACLLATFISPYGWELHSLLWRTATHTTADRFFRELHSLRFRQTQDYLLMLLTMAAFFALGRRRSHDLFLITLLMVTAVISFRTMRDNWLVVVVAVAIVGNAARSQTIDSSGKLESRSRAAVLWSSALAPLILAGVAICLPANATLSSKVSERFPLRAAGYIRQNHLPQPLFSTYEWGGLLTYALPEYAVSIDSRVDLYPEDAYLAYFKVMDGEVPLAADPTFTSAQTILLEANSDLARALTTLPGFRVAYQDNIAVVLVKEACLAAGCASTTVHDRK
jgi:hypothetical protein